MNIKKLLSVLTVLVLLLSVLPVATNAQSVTVPIEGPRVESVLTRTGATTPKLASGNHADYLDRVEAMPDYALEYYRWLEDNACAGGALADPTKATQRDGEYYHCVLKVSGSDQFTYTTYDEMLATAGRIAATALGKEFSTFSAWGGVIRDIFDREHPEVFWLSGRSSHSYLGSWSCSVRGNTCTVTYQADMVVWLKYTGFDIRDPKYPDAGAVAAGIDIRDAAIQEILSGCPEGNDYDRVAYLNDALTARNAYNYAVASGNGAKADSDAWECISALVGNSGSLGPVCEGYARAFQVLCDELEIPCVLVNGVAKSYQNGQSAGHMWNYVQMDDGWYAVDVTWNDPYVSVAPEQKKSGFECRKWLLLGTDTPVSTGLNFLASHTVSNRVRPNGLSFTNGPVLERTAYDPNAVPQYSVGGKVYSFSDEAATVQLWQGDTLKGTQSLNGSEAKYIFDKVEPGTYQITVSKPDHVTRTQEVTVTSFAPTCDVRLYLLGDVNGDGRRNMGDVAQIYGYIKGTPKVTDPYILQCADVNEDGQINVADAARLNGMINNTYKSL